ncbi:MAG: glucose-methanol-choline oxidoreductase, partial [Sphingomonas sp.]
LVAGRLFGEASIFVMIVEDFGYPDNRIVFDPGDPGRITVVYTVTDELRRRAREARRLTRRFLRGLRVVPLQTDVQLNFGHACGTCRAGHDPATSVLDGNCKVHDLDNLYVVDASFMPSSGGTNPGLTVIANALRVAEVIDARLGAREDALAAQ